MTTPVLLWARGIGEQFNSPNTMLAEVRKHLPPNYRVIEIAWPASYGTPFSYEQSLEYGFDIVLNLMDHTPGPIILAGFSGGAALMGDIANHLGGPHHKVKGALLIADPSQPRGVAPNGMFGVAGSRELNGIPGYWAYSLRDPIPMTPPLSNLRTIADQSAAMGLADPRAWGRDLIERLKNRRWQPSAWDWRDLRGSIRRINESVDAVGRYMRYHYTDYATGEGEGVTLTQAITAMNQSLKETR